MPFLIDPCRPYSLDELKEYVNHLKNLFEDEGKFEIQCRNKPETVDNLSAAGSTIGALYEQPFQENEMVIYDLPEVRGHLPEVEQANNRFEKAWELEDIPRPQFLEEDGNKAAKAEFSAHIYTVVKNVRAIRVFGVPINYMVQIVREGKDIIHKAFMDAVRVDPVE